MKKIFMLILVIALTTQAGYAQMFETPIDYIVSKERPFEFSGHPADLSYNKGLDYTLFYWSGREWIVNDLKTTDFITWESISADVNQHHKNKFLWDGDGYIVYTCDGGFQSPARQRTIYKMTPDLETILNSYVVPGDVVEMSYADGVYYARCVVDGNWSVFKLFCSTDLVNWQELANWVRGDELTMPVPLSLNGNSLSRHFQVFESMYDKAYASERVVSASVAVLDSSEESPVAYERILPKVVDVDGTYFWTSSQNGDVTTVEFSKDGVYWAGFEMPENIGDIQRIYPVGDRLIVQSGLNSKNYQVYITYVSFDKQEVYSMVEEALADEQAYVKLDNTILGFDQPPVIENDRMLVPMRFLFEQMGEEVGWENETQTATVMGKNDVVSFSIDNTAATVNGAEKTMDVPARLINDKTMIPLRFLSEELGYTVEWDDETKTAKITQ